ncbi:MAG: mechanosensitive ion channel domain-containing protein [Pseudomonadota bacterium]|nr:mechanosensitive ion channel domain-containing protein [Pseudomonadota bacterium]
MEKLVDPVYLETRFWALIDWLLTEVLVLSSLGQLAIILLTFLIAFIGRRQWSVLIGLITQWRGADNIVTKIGETLSVIALPFIWLVLQYILGLIAAFAQWPHHLMTVTVSLLTAWIIIRLTTVLIRDKSWAKAITIGAWMLAALNIVNLLDPTMSFLDSLDITLGNLRLSALLVIKGMLSLAILLWLASLTSRMLEQRIRTLPNLTPSMQVLFTKLGRILLLVIAVFVAMSIVGIDLTAFAVFSGALGVGIGFGLQKSVSNLFNGMMILMDRSIKPGDVIEVGTTYGTINSLGGRYASVITRDGIEHLIPNEELVSQRVANWTHSDSDIRLRLQVGISYGSDVPLAIATCVEAAKSVERVLPRREPNCLILGFGNSSIDLELRIWISDPANGVANVKSAVYLQIWKMFKSKGIEMPFPQRDVHIKSGTLST